MILEISSGEGADRLEATLSTEHAACLFGIPVLVLKNQAYGRADRLPDGRVAGDVMWLVEGEADAQEADLLPTWRETPTCFASLNGPLARIDSARSR